MDSALKILSLFGIIFCMLTMIINFLVKTFPRLPGDVDLRTPFQIYLPFTTAIVLTVVITILFRYFFG